MKCSQCAAPAFYRVQEQGIPLCLQCYSILHRINSIDFLMNVAMLNQSMDQMDAMSGVGLSGDRIPVQHIARAIQGSPTLNSFAISNSQVGVLNTGSIHKIDAAITLSKGSDAEPVADEIKRFTEEIIGSHEASDSQKNELLELTEAVAEEIVSKRRKSSIIALMKELKEKASGILALSNAADKLWEVVKQIST